MFSFRLGHAVLLLAFARFVSSQISGIDDVSTSPDQYGHPQCTFSNFTSNAIGIANFSVSTISQPLTWTVALSTTPDNSNQSQLLYDRNYIFGTPTSTGLANSTSLYGCGLFFEGLTPLLSFSAANNETSLGKCSDTIPANCVSDVIRLAQTEGQKLQQAQESNQNSSLCSNLLQRISKSKPESCDALKDGWGTILARDLTGATAAHTIKESSCHPTTGKDYDVSLVASYRRISSPEYDQIEPFQSGVTPIMTVFFDQQSKSAAAPDVKLTCLKALTSTAGETTDTGSKNSKSSAFRVEMTRTGYFIGVLSFVSVLIQSVV